MVFAETAHPEPLNLKYVKYTVPAPAATTVVPRRTFPRREKRPIDEVFFTAAASVVMDRARAAVDDDLEKLATTSIRVNWPVAEHLVERPTAADTRDKSAIDGLMQSKWIGGLEWDEGRKVVSPVNMKTHDVRDKQGPLRKQLDGNLALNFELHKRIDFLPSCFHPKVSVHLGALLEGHL